MCLAVVTEHEKPEAKGTGFKVVCMCADLGSPPLHAPIMGRPCFVPGTWEHDAAPATTGVKQRYSTGYHLFTREEDARSWLGGATTHSALRVRRCAWRNQRARGKTTEIDYGDTIVAAEIRLDEEIPLVDEGTDTK